MNFKKKIILISYFMQSICCSQLDYLITAEIKNDGFYDFIFNFAKTENINNILEIGSSSGEGSTEAFFKGIQENKHNPILFCVEVSKPRFNALQEFYKNYQNVKCYNVSSIKLEDFPTINELISFYKQKDVYECAIRWLIQDIKYIIDHDSIQDGIEHIKKANNIEYFDAVLIDGSEFTGKAELEKIYGAKFILLDDIRTFKNYENYYKLLKDKNYKLISEDKYVRNGYAVFKKIQKEIK